MARRSRFLVVLLVLVGLHACASAQSVMNSWLGHHQSDLIRSWGPPSSVASDGAGGTILIYIVAPSPAVTAPAQIALNDPNQPEWVKQTARANLQANRPMQRMMYVRADGTIYFWRIAPL